MRIRAYALRCHNNENIFPGFLHEGKLSPFVYVLIPVPCIPKEGETLLLLRENEERQYTNVICLLKSRKNMLPMKTTAQRSSAPCRTLGPTFEKHSKTSTLHSWYFWTFSAKDPERMECGGKIL